MTKRLIDVDDTLLEQVRGLLDTSTNKDTVNQALAEVVALAQRRAMLLEAGAVAGSDDLSDDQERRTAWA